MAPTRSRAKPVWPFAGRLQFALGPSAHVLDIGKSAKQLVLQRIAFRDKRFKEIGVAGLRVSGIDVAGWRFTGRFGCRFALARPVTGCRVGILRLRVHRRRGVLSLVLFLVCHLQSFMSRRPRREFRPLRTVI